MSLYHRHNSKIWSYKFKFNGQLYRGTTKTNNRSLALNYEKKVKTEIYNGKMLNHGKPITVEKALLRSLEMKPQEASYLRKLLGYKIHPATKERIPCAGLDTGSLLHNLSTSDLAQLVHRREQEGISKSTQRQEIIALRGAIKIAVGEGYRGPDLEYPVFKKKKNGQIRFLSFEEAGRFLQELDPKREGHGLAPYDKRSPELKQMMQDSYDLGVLLLHLGGRYSELAKMEWDSIDLNQKVVRLYRPKVQNESLLNMTDLVYEVLSRRFANRGNAKYIFQNKKGEARNYAHRSFQSAFRRAGIEGVTIHTLRKTFGSWLVRSGMSLYSVSKLLGHSSTRVTEEIYADLAPNQASQQAVHFFNKLNI